MPQKTAPPLSSNVLKTERPSSLPPPSPIKERLWLVYDWLMLGMIAIDLFIIGIDMILMSEFAAQLALWLNMDTVLLNYKQSWHHGIRLADGFFTIFLVVELFARWVISVIQKQHLRWFFFPIIHWYEVLGCFPQLRALRLLRAVVIIRKMYQLGYRVLPNKWLKSAKFYYDVIFEEISDRVILTATSNLRQQFGNTETVDTASHLLTSVLNDNQMALKATVATTLKQKIAPQIRQIALGDTGKILVEQVGASVHDALANTPELRRYLRMIPIAGGLIEKQLHQIGEHVAENLVASLTKRLTDPKIMDALINNVVSTIDDLEIEIDNPELDALIAKIINDGLSAFEQQIKIQQWQHSDHLKFKL